MIWAKSPQKGLRAPEGKAELQVPSVLENFPVEGQSFSLDSDATAVSYSLCPIGGPVARTTVETVSARRCVRSPPKREQCCAAVQCTPPKTRQNCHPPLQPHSCCPDSPALPQSCAMPVKQTGLCHTHTHHKTPPSSTAQPAPDT